MVDFPLEGLGHRIAQLRYRQQLKQSELARDAGVSLRTVQRLEAGDIVKTDVLLKVLQRLGRVDALLAALAPPELSPYEQLAQAGLSSTDLGKPGAANALGQRVPDGRGLPKRRVRRPVSAMAAGKATADTNGSTYQWPEDQTS